MRKSRNAKIIAHVQKAKTVNLIFDWSYGKHLGLMVKADDSGPRRPGLNSRERLNTFFCIFDECYD